jgi:choline dehydrogenase
VDRADGAVRDGILYPRAGTLGGCTAHNAMILIYPHNSDWDHIAQITGDPSWGADAMRRHFVKIEKCEYAGWWTSDASRHGRDGWLTTNVADPTLLVGDGDLKKLVVATVEQAKHSLVTSVGSFLERLSQRLENHFDPNDWRAVSARIEGICKTPLTTHAGRRVGSRDIIRAAQKRCGGNLTVQTHCLATKVMLDEHRRATGVEARIGAHLYRADPRSGAAAAAAAATTRVFSAKREVILSGGAFNTPQLLMLSGIGPRAELERHGIPVVVDLPGVGRNLQDRYEVGVVSRMKRNFALLDKATFRAPRPGEAPDPHFAQWQQGRGVYTTNGAIIAVSRRSTPNRVDPDLYLFGLAGFFEGYYPGYSKRVTEDKDHFTWCVLKAHTNNRAGAVTLRSRDPLDTPLINFRYFEEGNDAGSEDLDAVVTGVEYVREISARAADVIHEEVVPGPAVKTREQIRDYVRDNAWGHHASCTCAIGAPSDPMAVLDSDFRVRGVQGLRVVDASVFPRIPGFFIVSAVYMASEKASERIIATAAR